MSTEGFRMQVRDGVCEIQFTRPSTKNSFLTHTFEELGRVFKSLDADDSVSVVLIHGQGGNFTSGFDLNEFIANPPTGPESAVFRFMHVLHRFTKPVVAAVDGFAVGIGTTMLLHCDLVYASPDAKFLMPFVNLAVVPEAAATLLLPERAGLRLASDLLYFAEAFDTEVAERAGLVSRIVPDDDLIPFARKHAALLAAKPSASVRATKRLLKQASADAVARRIDEEATLFCELLRQQPAQDALAAFLHRAKK